MTAEVRSTGIDETKQNRICDTYVALDLETTGLNPKEDSIIEIGAIKVIGGQAADTYSPALIANFAFDLAKSFNAFYQDTPILKEQDRSKRNMRLCLTSFAGNTIKTAMHLLGIDVPERM